MANVIKIKRGAEVPTTNDQLAPGEIGFNTTDDGLYVNKGTDIEPDIVRVGGGGGGGDNTPDVVAGVLSSPGWYRVAYFETTGSGGLFGAGGIIDMEITRSGEAHKVTLIASFNNIRFLNEKAMGVQLITGVRWGYLPSGSFLDIYYDGTTANDIQFSVTSMNAPGVSFTSYEPFTDVSSQTTGYGSSSNLLGAESGSNTNGSYVKFSDGVQICWHIVVATYSNNRLLNTTWTYPTGFISSPSVVTSPNGLIGLLDIDYQTITRPISYSLTSTIKVTPSGTAKFTALNMLSVYVVAIGRWR